MLISRPGDRNIHHGTLCCHQCNHRLFCFLGECINRVNTIFDITKRLRRISSFEQFNRNRANTFYRTGADLFYALNAVQSLFDSDAYALFHFLWCGTKIEYGNRNEIKVEVRERFL